MSTLHTVTLSLALSLAACATDDPAAPPAAGDAEVARLTTELASLPGDLVVTRSSQLPFSAELRAELAAAGKVIHVFADGSARAYVGIPANAPAGVAVERIFRQHGGDIVIGDQRLLPDYLAQEDPATSTKGTANAVGLPIGHGALWADSTVAFEIDSAFSAAELTTVRNAISAWNASVDPSGAPMKVRFVPRYWADNRPYVRFIRGGTAPGSCGDSQVGRHDTIATNWWSHDIHIDATCIGQPTIQHEMGHTAGLFHEQQRCDRDSFINVTQPTGIDCERYCGGDTSGYGPYNYLSVMHYGYSTNPRACAIVQITPTASGFRGTPGQAGSAAGLDSFDIQAINQMYVGKASLPAIGPSAFFTFVPQYTSKVLAVSAGSTANDVPIVLFDRIAGVQSQHFTLRNVGEGFVEIRPRHAPTKCVEDFNFGTLNGAAVKQWDCWGGDNQKWIVAPSAGQAGLFDFINKVSGKSLDVPGWSTTNGTALQQWDHANGTNQRFALTPAF